MDAYTEMNPGITRIKQHYPLLSAQEKRVAEYVVRNFQDVLGMPVAEISKAAGVSDATVVRFCRSIGFSGMAEFKSYLRRELLSPSGNWTSFSKNDSIEQIAVKTMDYNKRAIDETLMVLSGEAVEQAAEAIDKAKRLVIIAEGGSACAARSAYDAFLQIGMQCSLVTDPFFQVLEASRLEANDVALGVCHSGRARNMVDAMSVAKDAGAKTISIVGIVGSPLTKISDIILYTGLADNSFYSETIAVRICELNVLSVLHTVLALKNSEKIGDYRSANSKLFELKRYKK